MFDRVKLLRKHTKVEHDIREAEIRLATSTTETEWAQARSELDELRVQLGDIEWQIQNEYRVP